jgi:hypothetical protein
MEEYLCAECEKLGEREYRDKFPKSGGMYGNGSLVGFELTRATKATPQLKMIKDILASILSASEGSSKGIFGASR